MKKYSLQHLNLGLTLGLALLLSAGSVSARTATAAPVPDATHEVVCECDCGGELQTYEWFPNFACSRYEGIKCDYGDGSQDFLDDCEKKAQPKDASLQPLAQKLSGPALRPGAVTIGGVVVGPSLPYQPYPLDIQDFSIPTGAEYQAWLDVISNDLFGSAFDGFVLAETPSAAGQSYPGTTATLGAGFTLDVIKIDGTETTLGYVDPATLQVFDLETVWLRGTLSSGSAVVVVEGVASTATKVGDPTSTLTAFLPLNGMYPYTSAKSRLAEMEADLLAATWDGTFGGCFKLEAQAISSEGDPCQACKDDGNKKIKRMKRDLKRCLFWTGAGAVVGGLASGGAGAILIGGIGGGYCADTALDKYGDIIEDFCACFAANDCGSHEKCPDQ